MKTIVIPLPTDINDIHYASGSFHSIYKSLSKVFNIVTIGPLKLKKNLLHSAFNRLNDYNIFPWRFATMHSWQTVNSYGKQIEFMIDDLEFDAIFATSTLHAAAVKTSKPMFAFTDLSYINALDYYGFASNLFPSSRKEALAVDKYCFEKYTKVFLASEWAKTETISAYKLNADKVAAIGRGANLTSNFSLEKLKEVVETRVSATKKNFLFVGNNWTRKGGDIAFEIVERFYKEGLDVKLQVVGCLPPSKIRNKKFVEIYKYLKRNDENDVKVFSDLYQNAFIFILPTRSEAMGISFNEASSFGLPSISYNTGGVGAAIENNVTGLLFNKEATIDDMFSKIKRLITNKIVYQNLAINAFNKYLDQNNWDTIALRIKDEIEPYLK